MGRLNELLGAGANFSRGVAVQFGLEEQEGVATVAPELVPTSDVHARPEQWALHGGTLLHGALSNGAIVGQRSYIQIYPGEGEIAVIESFTVETTGQYVSGPVATEFDQSTGSLLQRDARMNITAGGSGKSGTRLRRNTIAASIAGSITHYLVAGVEYHCDIVCVRPWGFAIGLLATNTASGLIYFKVRARPGTPRELAIGAL